MSKEHIDRAPYNCKECFHNLGTLNYHREGMKGPIKKLSFTPPLSDYVSGRDWWHDADKPILYVICPRCQDIKDLKYTKLEQRAIHPVEGRDS